MLTWGLVREAEFSSIAILALSPLRGEKRLKKCGISVTMSDFIYFFFLKPSLFLLQDHYCLSTG